MMHIIHHGQARPGSSYIIFLQMIKMNSGDMTCIYATLNHVHGLATRHHVPTPHRHNVRSTIVLGGIGDSVWVSGGHPLKDIIGENAVIRVRGSRA